MGKYLSSLFWNCFFAEFELSSTQFVRLPVAPAGFFPSDEVIEALEHAHSDNPAGRMVDPFVKFLEYSHCFAMPHQLIRETRRMDRLTDRPLGR